MATSRGEIVHIPSLIKAIKAKKLWGVALDVFEGEEKSAMFCFLSNYTFFVRTNVPGTFSTINPREVSWMTPTWRSSPSLTMSSCLLTPTRSSLPPFSDSSTMTKCSLWSPRQWSRSRPRPWRTTRHSWASYHRTKRPGSADLR